MTYTVESIDLPRMAGVTHVMIHAQYFFPQNVWDNQQISRSTVIFPPVKHNIMAKNNLVSHQPIVTNSRAAEGQIQLRRQVLGLQPFNNHTKVNVVGLCLSKLLLRILGESKLDNISCRLVGILYFDFPNCQRNHVINALLEMSPGCFRSRAKGFNWL